MTSLLLAGLHQLFCFSALLLLGLQRKGLVYQIENSVKIMKYKKKDRLEKIAMLKEDYKLKVHEVLLANQNVVDQKNACDLAEEISNMMFVTNMQTLISEISVLESVHIDDKDSVTNFYSKLLQEDEQV
jgi:hypothetical protein